PLAKVSFTTALYDSPVQRMPSCSHTGTPRHFHVSITSGSACLMSARTWASVLPRQSPSSLIRASISLDGDSVLVVVLVFFFMRRRSHEGERRSSYGGLRDAAAGSASRRSSHHRRV